MNGRSSTSDVGLSIPMYGEGVVAMHFICEGDVLDLELGDVIDAEGLRRLERRHDGASFVRRTFRRSESPVAGKWSLGWMDGWLNARAEGWNESSLGYFQMFRQVCRMSFDLEGRNVVRSFEGYRDDASAELVTLEEESR